MKTLVLTAIEGRGSMTLEVDHTYENNQDLLAAIRKAVREWRYTRKGTFAWKESHKDFNWGDLAIWYIPIPGVNAMQAIIHNLVVVNHDEVLMED